MKLHRCVSIDGEYFEIFQNDSGFYLCPVCGSPEHDEPPYCEDGTASFNMCSCGFEFGFDDSNLASDEACEGIVSNWNRWRIKVINRNKYSREQLNLLQINLAKIGVSLGFDLIPVKTKQESRRK